MVIHETQMQQEKQNGVSKEVEKNEYKEIDETIKMIVTRESGEVIDKDFQASLIKGFRFDFQINTEGSLIINFEDDDSVNRFRFPGAGGVESVTIRLKQVKKDNALEDNALV